MNRPIKSKVRHGMPSCAEYGCKRQECLEARRRHKRRIGESRSQGIRSEVSATVARAHLEGLLSANMPPLDIAKKSGVSESQIRGILRGKLSRIHRVTEEAILGTPVPEEGYLPNFDGLVGAVGAIRRLRALAVQGFPLSFLATESDMAERTVWEVRAGGQSRILISTLRSFVAVHDRLWDEDPGSMGLSTNSTVRARRYAESQGWFPTEAWADIDDPDCAPVLTTPRYVILTENYRELERQGYDLEAAAERLGVTRNYLDKAIRYHDAKAS